MSNRALGVLLGAAVVGLAGSALTGAQSPGGGPGQAPGAAVAVDLVAISGVLSPRRCSRSAMPTRTERSHAPS